ncbi:pentatricopeptide repeat-containing protein At1g08070, chloroplastic-like [Nymphaea colorata]|nr:pentatricopeptide repeat-containing protein At1g08070, chloroplastic-like [Nymphaea colorata]
MASMAVSVLVSEPVKGNHLPRLYDERHLSPLLKKRLALRQLKQIHAKLLRGGLNQDVVLVTKMVGACAVSGAMDYAYLLFRGTQHPDLVLCNAMLKGYTQNGFMKEALHFYVHVLEGGFFFPDQYTLPYVFKACAALLAVTAGRAVHAMSVKSGLAGDAFVGNSLVDFYAKCGDVDSALCAFCRIEEPNPISWNILIGSFVSSGDMVSARKLFDEMPERDVASWNTMLSGYAKAGDLVEARRVFEQMPERNLVSWNAMIAAYAQNGKGEHALMVFSQMVGSSVSPGVATMLTVMSIVSNMSNSDNVNWVVDLAARSEFANSVSILTAIVNLHAKFGRIDDAYRVFSGIHDKDTVCYNAMIGGFTQNQEPSRALELFRRMQSEAIEPDAMTMVSVLSACAQLGALGLGEWVHNYVERNGIPMDVYLGTALVDMYARCGDVDSSWRVFIKMPQRDVATWNAMIRGLAMHGHGNGALQLFLQMEIEGYSPNYITFVALLSACSHEGLVSHGFSIFNSMKAKYGIMPGIEHYGCMVDLLGRAKHLAEAREFIEKMPIEPDSAIWAALLSACRFHQNLELAKEATEKLIALNPSHDGNYVLLSNIYAKAGKWEDVARMRESMRSQGVRKTPGCSAVEIGDSVYEFTAGDRSHPQWAEIYAKWNELAKQLKPMGYSPDTGTVLRGILDEEEKEQALYRHSEKLAVSFALITTKPGTPIRIVKNLRICVDCHRAFELISLLLGREITIRDRNRFHHFREGHCSCRGYW